MSNVFSLADFKIVSTVTLRVTVERLALLLTGSVISLRGTSETK